MININKSSLRKIMREYKKLHKFSEYQDEQINILKQENESLKLENIELKSKNEALVGKQENTNEKK